MDWTEIIIELDADDIDAAADIAHMTVPYGMYIEDYRTLEQETLEIAHIDLIDEELLAKDKSRAFIHLYISVNDNPAEAIALLTELYSAQGIRHRIETAKRKNEDWENNWKPFFKPIKIGERLLIRPLWEDDFDAENRVVLNIEPGMAFGTGTHETTRLCLEVLEKGIKGGEKILDIGCGSGILSIAALLLGAKTAIGVDIDKTAVKTAIENGKVNKLYTPEYQVLCGSLTEKVQGKFNVITANIVADIVILLCSQISEYMEDNCLFIASGIIDNRKDDVLYAMKVNGFEIIAEHAENGWLCYECKKR